MALETGTFINDLTVTNPVATDPKSQGDDHIRLIKNTLKNSLPGFTGVILGAGTEAEGGSVNAFTVTLSPAPSAYTANTVVIFKSTHANTGAATLQINALGVKDLQSPEGSALVAGNLPSGMTCAAIYDGTAFRLVYAPVVEVSYSADIQTFASSGTWTKPAGAKSVLVELLGGGGGGGGGSKGASGVSAGGSGGGGGALHVATFPASVLGSTETITIASARSGGATKAVDGAGNNGTDGSSSTFGTLLKAWGGAGGIGGVVTDVAMLGGGGGGTGSAGAAAIGGNPGNSSASATNATGGGGGYSDGAAEYGGAGGGGIAASTATRRPGASSLWGGAGGGAGNGRNTFAATIAASAGGTCNSQTAGDGAAVNAAGVAVAGRIAGQGGGGGSGAVGGAGYLGSGGGGGAGIGGYAGGAGGAGYCRVTTFF